MGKLLQEVRLDLGLRSEFEAALREKLNAFRADPKLGTHTITVSLTIGPEFDREPVMPVPNVTIVSAMPDPPGDPAAFGRSLASAVTGPSASA